MPVKEQGFSLLEVLIAMAISSVLLLGAARFLPALQRESLTSTRKLALEEGTFSTAGEDNHHHDNANQAAVERHAAVPDTEQIQRIGHKLREIVEQNITNTSPEEDAEEARIE